MRSTCLLLFLFFFPLCLCAQKLVIAAVKQNVCYIGIDNPVQVAATGCSDSSLLLKVDNGTVRRSNGQWLYNPDTPGRAHLQLWCRRGGTPVLLGKEELRVKERPVPIATVAGIYTGMVQASTLRAQSGILVHLPNSDLVAPVVTNYTVRLRKKNGQTDSATIRSAYFVNESRRIIQDASPGDNLTITEITAIGAEWCPRWLNEITLQIR